MMPQESEEGYRPKPGDTIWFRSPGVGGKRWPWWPGLVIDKEASALKDYDKSKGKPIAYIKFNDKTEDVAFRATQVKPFDCSYKDEFLLSGNESEHVKKFTEAVRVIESISSGNHDGDDVLYLLSHVARNGSLADDERSETNSSASFLAIDDEISFRSPRNRYDVIEEKSAMSATYSSSSCRRKRVSDPGLNGHDTPATKKPKVAPKAKRRSRSKSIEADNSTERLLKKLSGEKLTSIIMTAYDRFKGQEMAPTGTSARKKARSLSPTPNARISPRAHASTKALMTSERRGRQPSRLSDSAFSDVTALGCARKSPRQHPSTVALLAQNNISCSSSDVSSNVEKPRTSNDALSRVSPRGHLSTVCRLKNPHEFGVAQKATIKDTKEQNNGLLVKELYTVATSLLTQKETKHAANNASNSLPNSDFDVKYTVNGKSDNLESGKAAPSQKRRPAKAVKLKPTKVNSKDTAKTKKVPRAKSPKRMRSSGVAVATCSSVFRFKSARQIRAAAAVVRARKSPRNNASTLALRAAALHSPLDADDKVSGGNIKEEEKSMLHLLAEENKDDADLPTSCADCLNLDGATGEASPPKRGRGRPPRSPKVQGYSERSPQKVRTRGSRRRSNNKTSLEITCPNPSVSTNFDQNVDRDMFDLSQSPPASPSRLASEDKMEKNDDSSSDEIETCDWLIGSNTPVNKNDDYTRGSFVFAKVRRFPFWPAVIKTVYYKKKNLDKLTLCFINNPKFDKTTKRVVVYTTKFQEKNIVPWRHHNTLEIPEEIRPRFRAATDYLGAYFHDVSSGAFTGDIWSYLGPFDAEENAGAKNWLKSLCDEDDDVEEEEEEEEEISPELSRAGRKLFAGTDTSDFEDDLKRPEIVESQELQSKLKNERKTALEIIDFVRSSITIKDFLRGIFDGKTTAETFFPVTISYKEFCELFAKYSRIDMIEMISQGQGPIPDKQFDDLAEVLEAYCEEFGAALSAENVTKDCANGNKTLSYRGIGAKLLKVNCYLKDYAVHVLYQEAVVYAMRDLFDLERNTAISDFKKGLEKSAEEVEIDAKYAAYVKQREARRRALENGTDEDDDEDKEADVSLSPSGGGSKINSIATKLMQMKNLDSPESPTK